MKDKKYIVAIYNDEEILLDAVKQIRSKGYRIYDVFTPFPVHGLEHALGYRDTRLHTFGFIVGATGMICALAFMTWINVWDYPINFGGKPFFSLPSYIPITFEATVLTSSVAMVLAFLARNGLYPGKNPSIFDSRTTDDKFAIVFEENADKAGEFKEEIESLLKGTGAEEVYIKEFEEEE